MKSLPLLLALLVILSIVGLASFASANSYYLEFNQVGDKIVVRESINGLNSSYVDSNLLEETKIGYLFLNKIIFPEDFESTIIKLNLDNGYTVGEDGAYPLGYRVETDGQIISLVWQLNNVKASEPIAVVVNIRDLRKGYTWVWILLGIIILIVVAYILFKYQKKRKTKNLDKHLLDIERKMLEELRKADRQEMWQRNLQKNLGLSKAKTSRLIRNLESRELVEKIPFGNTNKIVLK
ncbi:hypothetical protein FJZ17_00755 [Candidatus Pacearchaeota archaeon]|nr:hypothetical protein [Candidatus Pacearchaeota archaeon]